MRKLALAGHVNYGSRRVMLDVENLGYTPDDVHHCLASLSDEHYQCSIRYENSRIWLDEYRLRFTHSSGHEDNLYIKLKVSGDSVLVVLDSFHRQRGSRI